MLSVGPKGQAAQLYTNWEMGKRGVSSHKKQWSPHTFVTWTNLANIKASERSQTSRVHMLWFHLQKMSRIGNSIKTESSLVIASGWEEGEMGNDCFVGMKFPLEVMKRWLYSIVNVLKAAKIHTLKWLALSFMGCEFYLKIFKCAFPLRQVLVTEGASLLAIFNLNPLGSVPHL